MKANSFTTASALLESLSVADIEDRLCELIAEEKALRTVLRSLKAREREHAKQVTRMLSQASGGLRPEGRSW